MSGLIKTGTAIQKAVLIANGAHKDWQHNRGVKPLAVRCYVAATGQVQITGITITQADANTIRIANASGGDLTLNVFVDFDVNTQNANSLHGLPGTIPPTNGFV